MIKKHSPHLVGALALSLLSTGLAARDERPIKIQQAKYYEEVTVTATNLSSRPVQKEELIRVGLSNVVLVHIYDESTDTWKYVEEAKKQD